MRLAGRIVVVTGAARGIGAACARLVAAQGAGVLLSDIADGEPVAAAIRAAGGRAVFHGADAAGVASVAGMLDAAEAAFGMVDGCIAAAGIAPSAAFLETDEAEFMRVIEVNLLGPLTLAKQVARRLVSAGRPGSIVNISSTSGRLAGPEQAAYCASKGGLDSLTRVMAVALAPYGIRVNGLAPGPTDTGLAAGVPAEMLRVVLSRTPLGRFAAAEEQAAVAAFLLSEEASFITGEIVYADGGRSALNYVVMPA